MLHRKLNGKRDMPDAIARSDSQVQALWNEVHARAVKRYGEGPSADRVAFAALQKEYEQQGDRWVRKMHKRPPDLRRVRGLSSSTKRHGPSARGKAAHSSTEARTHTAPARREHRRNRRTPTGVMGKPRVEGRNLETRRGKSRAKSKVVVVDGSNIAYAEKAKDGRPQVSNLIAVRQALLTHGWQPIIIVDAALRHQVDDPARIEALIQRQEIRQAPADTDADYFILKTAENERADVVSNDEYQSFRRQFPWIAERRIPFMIVQGTVQLYEPSRSRKRRAKEPFARAKGNRARGTDYASGKNRTALPKSPSA